MLLPPLRKTEMTGARHMDRLDSGEPSYSLSLKRTGWLSAFLPRGDAQV
jgi:hypothetical protein